MESCSHRGHLGPALGILRRSPLWDGAGGGARLRGVGTSGWGHGSWQLTSGLGFPAPAGAQAGQGAELGEMRSPGVGGWNPPPLHQLSRNSSALGSNRKVFLKDGF